MRLYKLMCGAAARLFQNLTVLCHQAASRRFTGTSFHKRASSEWEKEGEMGRRNPLD